MIDHAEKRRQLRRFAPGLLLKTFVKLALVFFAPLALVSLFFLHRQYQTLNEQLHDSYLNRTGLIALQLENLIKDRAGLDPDNPLLIRDGRTDDLTRAFPNRRFPPDDAERSGSLLLFATETDEADEKEFRLLYYFPERGAIRYYLFQADFVGDYFLESDILKMDEYLFLLNVDGSPALSSVLTFDLEIPERWLVHLRSNDSLDAGMSLGRLVTVDEREYFLGLFPLPGLPFHAAIARPSERVLAPLYREMYIQAGFLALVLIAAFVFSFLTARDQIRPLQTLQEFLEHVADRDFSYIPRTDAHDERRDIFAAVNLIRRRLRRFDRMNAEELHRRNIELERLNEQKNQLLGMAAHDLRNPLGAIRGFSQFLHEFASPSMEAGHQRFVTRITHLSDYMLSLVNDLLDLSELTSGSLHLDRETADLIPVIKDAVATNRIFAEKKNISIQIESPLDSLLLPIDVQKIEQVLNNLLSNAVKYSHERTAVTVRVRPRDDAVEVAVIDQGQGIKEEELARIFQPFVKTSTRTTAGENSTGLGLSIVRRIVEGHGGTINVESVVDAGSAFRFDLPLRVQPETQTASGSGGENSSSEDYIIEEKPEGSAPALHPPEGQTS